MKLDFLVRSDELPPPDLSKPTRLSRDVAKYERQRDRMRERRAVEKREREAWMKVRAEVYARDGGICRALGIRLKLRADDPMLIAQAHHILFRSLGGQDVPENLICLSPEAHALVHGLNRSLWISGDGNGLVTFTRKNPETGRVIEVWDSTPRGRVR